MRRKIKPLPSQYTGPGSSESKPIIINNEAVSAADPIPSRLIPDIPRSEVLPPYLLLQNRPPPKPPDQLIKKQDASDTKKKTHHFRKILYLKFMRPDKTYFQEPFELKYLIDTKTLYNDFCQNRQI